MFRSINMLRLGLMTVVLCHTIVAEGRWWCATDSFGGLGRMACFVAVPVVHAMKTMFLPGKMFRSLARRMSNMRLLLKAELTTVGLQLVTSQRLELAFDEILHEARVSLRRSLRRILI